MTDYLARPVVIEYRSRDGIINEAYGDIRKLTRRVEYLKQAGTPHRLIQIDERQYQQWRLRSQ